MDFEKIFYLEYLNELKENINNKLEINNEIIKNNDSRIKEYINEIEELKNTRIIKIKENNILLIELEKINIQLNNKY